MLLNVGKYKICRWYLKCKYAVHGKFIFPYIYTACVGWFVSIFSCQGQVVINCIWATGLAIIDNRSSLVSTYKTTVTQLCKQEKIRQKITHTKYLVTESCFSQNIKTILLIYGLMRPLICTNFSKHYQMM